MAILAQNIKTLHGTVAWADAVPAIQLTATAPVTVTVRLEGETVLVRVLQPLNGSASLDITALVQEWCQIKRLGFPTLGITASSGGVSESVEIRLIPRTRNFSGTAADFIASRFMTLGSSFSGGEKTGVISLILLPGEQMDMKIQTWYRDADGAVSHTGEDLLWQAAAKQEYSVWSNPVSMTLPDGATPLMSVVTQGKRKCRIFFNRHATDCFSFINPLGQREQLYCRADVAAKHTLKASSTLVKRQIRRYDATATTEYTATFGPTAAADTERIAWLAESAETSWSRRLANGGWSAFTPIVVTDATTESDPDPDQLAEPKLTFRINSALPVAELPALVRIHSAEFSNPFN